jgi:ligand-binding sensor domain-containing protein/signal transduction histidine kinase
MRHIGAALSIAAALTMASRPRAFALNPSLSVTQYAHRAWTVSEGFFKGEIHAIAQTPDGYLWLATEFGLLRFDGVRAVLWQAPTGEHLPSNDIRGLAAARDGTLWLGTAKGLVSLKDGTLTHYPQFDGHDVNALLEDGEGALWASGTIWEAGLTIGNNTRLCSISRTRVQCYGMDGSFGVAGVTALYEDSRGNLWLGASNGVWRWRPGPRNHYELSNFYGSGGFIFSRKAFLEDKDGALVISGPRGIAQLLNGKVTAYPLPAGAPLINGGALLRDRHGGLWIGTLDSGVVHVYEGRADMFTEADGLSSNPVRNLFEDREGNVWVATVNGLDRFREYAVPSLSVKEGLSSPFVRSVLADRDGNIWLGTPHGLNRWTNGQLTVYRKSPAGAGQSGEPFKQRARLATKQSNAMARDIIDPGLPDEEVGSLYQDNQGRVWVTTAGGVAYIQKGRFHPLTDLHLPHWFMAPVALDSRMNLWMTSDEGLYRLRGGTGVEYFPSAEVGLRGLLSTLLVTDPVNGGLWLASWQGGVVYWKDKHVLESYWPRDGLGSGRVNALYLDQENSLWAGTDGGLSRIRNGRVATLTSNNGLPCDTVHSLAEDDEHSFWVYMACGLVRISRPEMDAWVGRPMSRIATTMFDIYDGVRTHSGVLMYAPRMTKAADGKLWFVTLNGVSVVDPRHLRINNVPPPVRIEQITADRKAYDAASARNERLRLPPRIHDLAISYTALSFVAPEKVHFRFKLEGQDEHWREVVNDRRVQYSNLSPRTYRFRVIACNNSGLWNEAGAALDFSIDPAYYQTNWFRALCVATFLAALYLLYLMRVRHLAHEFNLRTEERVHERTRIARELHDTLLQSVQASLIQMQTARTVLSRRPEQAGRTLDQAIETAEGAIAEGRDAIHDLRSQAGHTKLAKLLTLTGQELAAAQNADGKKAAVFRAKAEGEERKMKPLIQDEIYRIACELLRNAFQHAEASEIEAEIRYEERALRLRVRDDGKGIDAKILKAGGRAGHWGLVGMRERAKEIGGRLEIWSNASAGTEVELMIPAAVAYARTDNGGRFWRRRSKAKL